MQAIREQFANKSQTNHKKNCKRTHYEQIANKLQINPGQIQNKSRNKLRTNYEQIANRLRTNHEKIANKQIMNKLRTNWE